VQDGVFVEVDVFCFWAGQAEVTQKAGEPQTLPPPELLAGSLSVVPIVVSVNFNRNCLKSNILPRFSLTIRL
jgi:hypothetical protein